MGVISGNLASAELFLVSLVQHKHSGAQTETNEQAKGYRSTFIRFDSFEMYLKASLTLSLPESLMEFCKVTLTFESVDKILCCYHSNGSSLPVLTHGAVCFSKFYKMKFGNLVEICLWLHLAVKGLKLLSICLHWGSSIYSCVRLI